MVYRKTMAAMAALACLAVFSSTEVSARGGFGGGFRGGGGGFHGGGFHAGGFHGGWRGSGYGWGGRGLGLGIGLGLAGAYGYPYGYGYGYPASYAFYGDGGCYIRRQRVWTSYGWRFRTVQVCGY
jgi:hypothetical protein